MRTLSKLLTVLAVLSFSTVTYAVSSGDKAPNFKLRNIFTGKAETLSKYRGKVVYLDFWASWCGPCRQSLPMLNQLRQELKRKGFEVVAVNLDENSKDAKRFLQKTPVSYPVLLDPKGKTPNKYDLPGMPTSYLIDKRGKIRAVHVGFKPSKMAKIRKQVMHLLKR